MKPQLEHGRRAKNIANWHLKLFKPCTGVQKKPCTCHAVMFPTIMKDFDIFFVHCFFLWNHLHGCLHWQTFRHKPCHNVYQYNKIIEPWTTKTWICNQQKCYFECYAGMGLELKWLVKKWIQFFKSQVFRESTTYIFPSWVHKPMYWVEVSCSNMNWIVCFCVLPFFVMSQKKLWSTCNMPTGVKIASSHTAQVVLFFNWGGWLV